MINFKQFISTKENTQLTSAKADKSAISVVLFIENLNLEIGSVDLDQNTHYIIILKYYYYIII